MHIDETLSPAELLPSIERLWALSGPKLESIDQAYSGDRGAPVFTVRGRYTARGWTEWTQGFQYGANLLQFDATGEAGCLRRGRQQTLDGMTGHVTHFGVHDHGFNNVSTYGNLWRLAAEGRVSPGPGELRLYKLALACSGAVQARRWTALPDGGFIYSFNGPHSLFADTIRSLRVLALAHALGHCLYGEQDEHISLLGRLIDHARATARYNVYYGEQRDAFDVPGRVAHESIFNCNNGSYRCPSSQQGYSPFSTWTRGLAWIMCGYAEELEFLATLPDDGLDGYGGRQAIETMLRRAAIVACDFYIEHTPTDGIPYWDTGAPGLTQLGAWHDRPADPYNHYEPVDSSAAAIGAQGLLRLGHYLRDAGDEQAGSRYWQAGLTVLRTLFSEPYLATDPEHQGLILHSVYHRPNGWDWVPEDQRIPCGESSMWGDYHAREVALYVQRIARGEPYLVFFGGLAGEA